MLESADCCCCSQYETLSLEGVTEELCSTRQETEVWKRKVEDLEQKKKELMEAIQEALRAER